jgi:hypothetical protein
MLVSAGDDTAESRYHCHVELSPSDSPSPLAAVPRSGSLPGYHNAASAARTPVPASGHRLHAVLRPTVSTPLDNVSVSGIQVPERRGNRIDYCGNTATDGARLQSTCRCSTRAPRMWFFFLLESRIQWTPRVPGLLRQGLPRSHAAQNLIPDFYPGLVKTAPENLFNNRQWRPGCP